MRLAIIDLDGVIANVDARFQQAELAKEQWLMERQQGLPYANDKLTEKSATDVYWRSVFNPEYVPMDTLIPGANDALCELDWTHELIILLTSRPESMRQVTFAWLTEHTIFGSRSQHILIMKPPAAQYVKTVVWKALTIQMLVSLYDVDDVLVVDDEGANLAELQKYDVSHMRLCSSLAEAITPIEQAEDSPF